MNKKQLEGIDVFMFIFLLLVAFRGLQCGNDTKQYMNLYNEYSEKTILSLFSGSEHELGYKLLNKLVSILIDNYQVFLSITAVSCVCPLWHFYKRESENQLLTIALFVCVAPFSMYFSGIRQSIAMSLGIWTWYVARNKKFWPFAMIVLLAMQVHISAFVLFLLYPLYYAKITKKALWFVVPCMIAVYIFRARIFEFLFKLLWQEYDTISETGAIMVLILLILFAIYSYVIPNEELLDQDVIAMRNILLLSVVIQIFAMLHPLSMRLNYYFLIFIPILIPKIACRSKKQYADIAKLSVIIMTVYFMFYFLNNLVSGSDDLNIVPYIPFWKNY